LMLWMPFQLCLIPIVETHLMKPMKQVKNSTCPPHTSFHDRNSVVKKLTKKTKINT